MDSEVLTSKRDDLQKMLQQAAGRKADLERQHAQICTTIENVRGALMLLNELDPPAAAAPAEEKGDEAGGESEAED